MKPKLLIPPTLKRKSRLMENRKKKKENKRMKEKENKRMKEKKNRNRKTCDLFIISNDLEAIVYQSINNMMQM